MEAWLRDEALALGFDRVGFAVVEPDFRAGERFREWLRRGHHADMRWLDRSRERRADPGKALPGVRSAIVLAYDYPPPIREPEKGEGRVASYARGRDYHNALGRRFRKYMRRLRARYPNEDFYGSLDTGAVLEKAYAVRAGLGWMAKNTLVLDPVLGSYALLAVALTTLVLAPSPTLADQCGDCRLCLDACPTAAFPEPYVLDARRCLSYLTIESRAPFPLELREAAGDHLFGCDVCQSVCPWNLPIGAERRGADLLEAATAGHEALAPLLESAAATDRFRGRALARPGSNGMLRNAIVVAANTGDGRWTPALIALLAHSAEAVRVHAAWALGRLGGGEARAALERASAVEPSPVVLAELNLALRAGAGGSS